MHSWIDLVCEWFAGRAAAGTERCPHHVDFLTPNVLVGRLSFSREKAGVLSWGGAEAQRRSDVEAFPAATHALDVWVVEDKFTGQL